MDQDHVTFAPRRAPPPDSQPPDSEPKPRKLRRISRACDFCHKRSIRCKPSQEDATRCQNCLDFGVGCTYNRPAKKRGIKSGNAKASQPDGASPHDEKNDARMLLELTNGIQGNGTFNVVDKFVIPEKWRSMVLANEGKIRNLVDVYFEVVYPIFPLFHTPTMLRRTANRDYLTDHSFFADVMAVCALASARARDGALFPGRWDVDYFQSPAPEVFFAAAKETIPHDLGTMQDLDWLRACTFLALYGIQVGKINIMHQYLGLYHSLVAMDGLHDEKNWPKGIGIVEIELRRRLFWCMYTLEVFSSIIWGNIIRCRESQCNVSYPSEVDDEFFSDAGYQPPNALVPSFPSQTITNPISWLHGWNFTAELYRVLEHAMDEFHRRRPKDTAPFSPGDLFTRESPDQSVVLDKVMAMHEALPQRFKEAKLTPENGKGGLEDKFSFQAANITATLQLVRMVLFTAEDATVDQKCTIARELLDGFSKVPVFFLRAISSPLLHHLAGIGSILGSAIEGPLSDSSYFQAREVLLAMADLLGSLEIGITRAVGAASRIRSQVEIIENYMTRQRQQDLAMSTTANPTFPPQVPLPAATNPNIDPSLQSTASAIGLYQQPQPAFDSKEDFTTSGGSADGMNVGMNPASDQFQFQLPPELLEGWPWPFDMSQGLSSF